jgi:phosphoglucomutase
VASCALIAEITAWSKSKGKSLYEQLLEIYLKYGFYKEKLVNIVRKGKEGADEIKAMMAGYRSDPPQMINGSRVVRIADYLQQVDYDMVSGAKKEISLVRSDVLQFFLEDGTKISVRPSGTEPKIKFYFSVNTKLESVEKFDATEIFLDERIDRIIKDMKLV